MTDANRNEKSNLVIAYQQRDEQKYSSPNHTVPLSGITPHRSLHDDITRITRTASV
jgi:hypothetical protein